MRRAGGERGPGTPRLRGRKRGAAPNRQGGAGADADSAGARGLQPWRSSALHLSTSCLAIYSHLLSENSFTHVSGPDKRKGGPPHPQHTHAAKLRGDSTRSRPPVPRCLSQGSQGLGWLPLARLGRLRAGGVRSDGSSPARPQLGLLEDGDPKRAQTTPRLLPAPGKQTAVPLNNLAHGYKNTFACRSCLQVRLFLG